jgi:hypothetical protein
VQSINFDNINGDTPEQILQTLWFFGKCILMLFVVIILLGLFTRM